MLKRILRSTIIRKRMPVTTAEQLETLQDQVRASVLKNTSKALRILTDSLPSGRAKHNQVLVLTGRANDIINHEIGNTLPPDLLAILNNELRKDILIFTDHLTLADFGPKPDLRPELKPGHLLYKVPPVMELRKAYHCIIRIAHELNHVLDGIKMDESTGLGQVSVSEVMEIEVIDPSAPGNPAFDIVLLSDGEQFVDEYSATEWVFNVRPLREGTHSLALKISVLLTINGKERTKNIVHQREISVRAEAAVADVEFVRSPAGTAAEETEGADFPRAERLPPKPYPAPAPAQKTDTTALPPPPVMAPAPHRKSKRFAYLSAAATVMLLCVVAIFMLPSNKQSEGNSDKINDGPSPIRLPEEDLSEDTLTSIPLSRPDSL
ncbi:hypothetical protein FUA23_03100 [Neolewinella aurantiaca]|uniref:Uncharacterized protein n=1 Tax=Neolewinella aurantiaca TaxID=2602767 RepID=A0A5C7FWY7_9BACT|nr:hypothetical protein [Neolewinella aurantiaca]TXF91224.1 hypothetical protein FUA23_03100 [Neolewinella aurantiaca]